MLGNTASGGLAIIVAFAAALPFNLNPSSSHAAEGDLYATGAMAVGLPRDTAFTTATTNEQANLDPGFASVVTVGRGFGNGFSTELEVGYRGNDVDDVSGARATGKSNIFSYMLNGQYDFRVGWPIKPFLGAGIGIAHINASGISPGSNSRVDATDTAFAYQATAGIAYPMNDRMDLTLSYRYFAVPDVGLNTNTGAGVDSNYTSHTVRFGFRYRFNKLWEALAAANPGVPRSPVLSVAASPVPHGILAAAMGEFGPLMRTAGSAPEGQNGRAQTHLKMPKAIRLPPPARPDAQP